MDYLFQDGGKPKAKKSKTASKTTKSKTNTKTTKSKSSSKTGTKTTKSKTTSKKSSSKKGGNFLGAVGDLVAPTGWGPFATAAGLLALDRVDSALRRGKSEKSSAKKMSGGGGPVIKGPIYNSTPNQKGKIHPFTDLPIYLTPNEQAVKNRFNKYYSDNRNIIEYYDNSVKEYTPIPKKTYDEIKQICIKKERTRKNSSGNRPKYLSISVAMQDGISDLLRKVYWDHIIFKLYHGTVNKYGEFSLEKMVSIPFFNEI
jgi:hypothetical protein